MDESRSVSRDPEDAGASTDDGGGDGEEVGRSKACTECKLLKASTEVRRRCLMGLSARYVICSNTAHTFGLVWRSLSTTSVSTCSVNEAADGVGLSQSGPVWSSRGQPVPCLVGKQLSGYRVCDQDKPALPLHRCTLRTNSVSYAAVPAQPAAGGRARQPVQALHGAHGGGTPQAARAHHRAHRCASRAYVPSSLLRGQQIHRTISSTPITAHAIEAATMRTTVTIGLLIPASSF